MTEDEKKEAKRLYDKKYGEKNREKLLKKKQEYYQENKEKIGECRRLYRLANPEKVARLQHRYRVTQYFGISVEEYETLKAQAESCAICGYIFQDSSNKVLDHCHRTGRIRGVLCNLCNKGLGQFQDNQNSLTEAVKYLQEYSS